MVRLVALAALTPGLALAGAYRFGAPVAVQLISVEAVICARPLRATDRVAGAAPGRTASAAPHRTASAAPDRSASAAPAPPASPPGSCLSADLAVTHRGDDGQIHHLGTSYLLEQRFSERVALDFGPYAEVVLRELARGVAEAELEQKSELRPVFHQTLKQVQRHVHYEVLPHVVLPLDVELAVTQLADRFHARARCPLVITSGPRTPESQALAMYLKLNQGVSLTRLYRKTEAAQEIRKAYLDGRRDRKRHTLIIAAMAEVIREQMQRGVYVSPHLKGGAVDIRSRTMNRNAKFALQRAVASFRGMRLIREEKIPPHFHLELKPVD